MDISKLYIFSKDTDANDAIRGYQYQFLKTLETWIFNYYNNINELIYCDYEDDIFHKDRILDKVKFRQIKLYSSNFSFKSEEIEKCLVHFFMLHVKIDYRDHEKEFVFETNSSVARKYKNNDAELLKEWYDNQDNLSLELLKKLSAKVKTIISSNISTQTGDVEQKEIKEALAVLNKLSSEDWINFCKKIKWSFLNASSDQEFFDIKLRIEALLSNLPFEINADNISCLLGTLHNTIWEKASAKKPNDRLLNNSELETLILSTGSNSDKWYSRRYEYYRTISEIEFFRIGEFYEILDLAKYCRRKKYLHRNKGKWNSLLRFYTKGKISGLLKRKAIYELIFLNNEFHEVNYDNLNNRECPKGSLHGLEDLIRFYFADFKVFENAKELERAKTIIDLLFVAIDNELANITYEELRMWFLSYYKTVSYKIINTNNLSEKCELLEQKGTCLFGLNRLRNSSSIKFTTYYDQILDLVDHAPLYNLSQFGDRIGKHITIQINYDPTDKLGITSELEEFSEKLFPKIEEREGKYKLAKQQVKRGYDYLKTNEHFNILKALEYFHKAKDNFLQEDTLEGYVLALLGLSHLYNRIGMHFASKHYALATFRISTNNEYIKHTESSLVALFDADFKTGSWFNSLEVYFKYIYIRFQSNIEKTDFEIESLTTQKIALVTYIMLNKSAQFEFLIDDYFRRLDYVGDEIIIPLHDLLRKELENIEKYEDALIKSIDDKPLNDIGETRNISFFALGSLWEISFENEYEVISIAEEYISAIQVILAEIALSSDDFHLIKSEIEIELFLSDTYRDPELQPSNTAVKWKVYIVHIDSTVTDELNIHSMHSIASISYILNNISLLRTKEFTNSFLNFIKTRGLERKMTAVNLYQRMHRDLYTKCDSILSKSKSFSKEKFDISLPKENVIMKWDNALSDKYDKESNILAIKNRFANANKAIYLTISNLKQNKDFPIFISNLRSKGWKDWQIILGIFNTIINYKINLQRQEDIVINSYQDYYNVMFKKYLNMDEKDCYIHFPLKTFQTNEFENLLEIGICSLLDRFGLEIKSDTPNFKAIKGFLDIRFNMAEDDYHENNPLAEI